MSQIIKNDIHYLLLVLMTWWMSGCDNTPQTKNVTHQDTLDISSFQAFQKKFTQVDSLPVSFDNDNGLAWYNQENVIEDTLFNAILKDQSFHDFRTKISTFAKSEENISFQYVCQIPLSDKFQSFLISVNRESPTHKWKTFLVNFSRDGDFRDAILISYRDSFMKTMEKNTLRFGEYRTTQFLKGGRIKVHDVVYDNRIDNPNITDPEEKPLEDHRYNHLTTYQIRFDGTFKMLKDEEKSKEEGSPD